MEKTLETRAAKLKMIGGRLCLDFTNTVGGRDNQEPHARTSRVDYTIREDNKELTATRAHERLTQKEERFVWAWDDKSKTLDSVLWAIARSASELLTSDELPRVRQCGGESCGWLFLDTSRNRSRQWCDMRDCGNLSKVHRFRQRQLAEN